MVYLKHNRSHIPKCKVSIKIEYAMVRFIKNVNILYLQYGPYSTIIRGEAI